MRKTQWILTVVLGLLIFASCSTNKKTTKEDIFTAEMKKQIMGYPEIIGFEQRVIFPAKLTPEEEENSRIEIIPGRVMYADCNQYGLQGNMLKKSFENGNEYFLFNTNGQVFSTQMACPDDSRREKFVSGETVITEYSSERPLVVYANQNIDIKYSLWKISEAKSIQPDGNKALASEEAKLNASAFKEKTNMVKHVLYLPKLSSEDETNRKVEIIPGKTLLVDCNKHRISGTISVETLEGFGFEYHVFNSDGKFTFTRKACPRAKEKKFVSGETKLLHYSSKLPIVVYTPPDFEVNYKIWETNGKMY